MSDDFFIRIERQLQAAELRELNRRPALRRFVSARRLLSVPLAAAAAVAVVVVALVAVVVVTVARESDVERPAAPPGKKVVATDVERGVRFSLDGRVLTLQLLPDRPDLIETVSGTRISATCGANLAASSSDPRSETTLTRRWPVGQTSLSIPFPRAVSSWCLLRDQSGSMVAYVGFSGAPPEAQGPIAETAIKWARLVAAGRQICNEYTAQNVCEQLKCQRVAVVPIADCNQISLDWAFAFLNVTVQATAVRGDRAAATLSNGQTVQMRRTATGEWLIDKLSEDGLPAELRRQLMKSGRRTG
jgi:hypothetical protein